MISLVKYWYYREAKKSFFGFKNVRRYWEVVTCYYHMTCQHNVSIHIVTLYQAGICRASLRQENITVSLVIKSLKNGRYCNTIWEKRFRWLLYIRHLTMTGVKVLIKRDFFGSPSSQLSDNWSDNKKWKSVKNVKNVAYTCWKIGWRVRAVFKIWVRLGHCEQWCLSGQWGRSIQTPLAEVWNLCTY